MRILALDLATQTGWALGESDYGRILESGTEGFQVKKFDGAGMRYLKFSQWLSKQLLHFGVEVVYFEGVRRHMGVDAAHVYGGMLATMQSVCEQNKTPYCALSVQEIKKMATGKGNAKKDAMIAAAKARFIEVEILDDNHADALWILELAFQKNRKPQATDFLD